MSDNLRAVIDYCTQQILLQSKRPLFLAITGDSGSGKSFLTQLIKSELISSGISCSGINHDDFLISRADREPMKKICYESGEFAGKSHWELLENMFRLDDYQSVISELKNGRCAEYYAYSRDTGELSTSISKVCPADVNLFDTSMMIEHMDYVILVDVSQENIIKRKIARDSDIRTPEQITDMHKKVQGYYWSRRKASNVDIVIDNNDFKKIHVSGNTS